jgi:hypothetical protein
MKNYGLIIEPHKPEDFLGGTDQSLEAKYGGTVINPSGDWTPYLPSTEDQDTTNGDTYACVSYGTSNAIEMLARFLFKENKNLSDRYLAKTSGTIVGQGNSPTKVADTLRKTWTVNEPEWPDVDTVAEFYAEPPPSLKTVAALRAAEFEFGYQFIPNNTASIKAHLTTSPVCIAVKAWKDQNGVYVDIPGMQPNHWTTLVKVLPNGNYLCFDSFFPFEKEVHPSACTSVAMSYYLDRKLVVSDSVFTRLVKYIISLFTDPTTANEPAPTVPTPPPAPVGDEKLIAALIQVESEGNDNAIGDRNLANKAYGCLQIRKPYVDDVNAYLGTSYKAQDCLGNRELSIAIFRAYMKRYKLTTDEQKARAHNGGPAASRVGTKQYYATNGYWAKVRKWL